MFINILFTGKFFNEQFTGGYCRRLLISPVLFTGYAIYFRGIFNPLDSLEEIQDFSYAKLKSRNPQMTA